MLRLGAGSCFQPDKTHVYKSHVFATCPWTAICASEQAGKGAGKDKQQKDNKLAQHAVGLPQTLVVQYCRKHLQHLNASLIYCLQDLSSLLQAF